MINENIGVNVTFITRAGNNKLYNNIYENIILLKNK